ncbi:MAG: DUF4199 domain-containing protein [Bacteroidota bacterium]
MEETTDQPSTKQIVLKWGLILGLISLVTSIITFTMGITSSAMSFLGGAISIVVIVLAHKEYKNDGDGFMSYGKGLGIGTLLSLVSGAISSVFSYVYLKFVDASYLDVVRDEQIAQMQESGMPDDQIEQALEFSSFFSTPEFMLIAGLFFAAFFGFILSLIISAFTKNNDPSLEI